MIVDALVMCGGGGSRLGTDVEKPLVRIGETPMLDRVVAALDASAVERVYAAVSPQTPETRVRAETLGAIVIDTPGDDYVSDLDRALARVRRSAPGQERADQARDRDRSPSAAAAPAPVLTVAADLPLLGPDLVDDAVRAAGDRSLTVCVPAALKRLLGASVDATFAPGTDDVGGPAAGVSPAGALSELAPSGLNVVAGSDDAIWASYDARLAVNVNRPADVDLAEALC